MSSSSIQTSRSNDQRGIIDKGSICSGTPGTAVTTTKMMRRRRLRARGRRWTAYPPDPKARTIRIMFNLCYPEMLIACQPWGQSRARSRKSSNGRRRQIRNHHPDPTVLVQDSLDECLQTIPLPPCRWFPCEHKLRSLVHRRTRTPSLT